MNTLYVNGCSFSCAGGLDIDEVKELYNDRGIKIKNHLDFAWPTLLSKKLKIDRKSTRLNSSHVSESRMPSSA